MASEKNCAINYTKGMGRDDDMSSVISFNLPKDGKSTDKNRSASQNAQLARAREVALKNRRAKALEATEARLVSLRAAMGNNVTSDQMCGLVKHLAEVEDRHRTKLASIVEKYTQHLGKVYDELKSVRTRASTKGVGTLSDISA